MKIFNRIVIALEALCVLGIIYYIFAITSIPGTEVDDILSAIDLDLPKYNIVYTNTKVIRPDIIYHYEITFSQKDSTALVKQLQRKGWIKSEDGWYKSLSNDVYDFRYFAFVNPKSGTAGLKVCNYNKLHYWVCIMCILLVAVFVAVIWCIVKISCKIIHRIKYKRWRN